MLSVKEKGIIYNIIKHCKRIEEKIINIDREVFDKSEDIKEILGDKVSFEDIIENIRKNGFRIEPEIIIRQSGKGVKLSEAVNLNLQKEEKQLHSQKSTLLLSLM